jgi:hypothetical protein
MLCSAIGKQNRPRDAFETRFARVMTINGIGVIFWIAAVPGGL